MSAFTAEQEAQKLLAQTEAGIPVDMSIVADFLSLPILEEELEDSVSGMLVVNDRNGIIGVNRHHHANRQRFTAAHEIGHFLLHRTGASVFVDANPVFFRDNVSSTGTKQQEIEANAFAAELLMPTKRLRERVNGWAIDLYDDAAVQKLARSFGVSAQALTIKLVKLGLIS